MIFIILKMCFIDCSLFGRLFSLFFHGFHDFKKFSSIDYCQLLFIDVSLLLIDFHYFQDVAHYFHGC